jgi:hypothetical protein
MKTFIPIILAAVVTASTVASQNSDSKSEAGTAVAQRFCPGGRC